ncbi:MAG: prepilin-type N-terminal cleavage/methylation domain-containing protein [Ruminococcus sp.]|nr:prepilin-type N-terminal cleavage/methylation domain-containing protein [Ruminococcus sp.]
MKKNRKGFTLVELVIVIAIIGILACIIIPTIYNYVQKARVKAAIADARTIKVSIENSLVDHLMLEADDPGNAFNKVLYLDRETKKGMSERQYEIVGSFTNVSWVVYRTNENSMGKSQVLDKAIAKGLDKAFSEEWDTGKKTNPMKYNSNSQNCEKFLKDNNTNFAIVAVYNRDGAVRMLQIYRKGILVTYINGEYIANTNTNAHFVGTGTWDTIYKDSGKSSPEEFCKVNLSNKQIGNDGNLGGWY